MRQNKLIAILIFAAGTLSLPTLAADTVGLQDYLDQVSSNHSGYKASAQNAEAAELSKAEGDLITTPRAYLSGQRMTDKADKANPALMGTKTEATTYGAGIETQTSIGLSAKLGYNLTESEVFGTDPLLTGPQTKVYEAGPKIEVSQALWKNQFGREVRAQAKAQKSSAEAKRLAETHTQKVILAEAEAIYWRLSVARESVKLRTENLERAKKLRDWAARRSRFELSDRADLLQAETAYQARAFELQIAQDEEQAVARAFNSLRGKDSNQVSDVIQSLNLEKVTGAKAPESSGVRADVEAARYQAEALEASSTVARDRYAPDLKLFASYGLNGRELKQDKAISEGFKNEKTTTVIGVKIEAPIGFGTVSRQRAAAAAEASVANLRLNQKKFEAKREWQDLNSKLSEAQGRLKQLVSMEKAQEEKLEYERKRFQNGRTTTFQLLQFESDFAGAQLQRIRAEIEVIETLAKMKVFGGTAS